MENQEPIELISISQVCNKLEMSKSSIYNLIRDDGFPHPVKIGKASRWVRSAIEEWLRARIPKAA